MATGSSPHLSVSKLTGISVSEQVRRKEVFAIQLYPLSFRDTDAIEHAVAKGSYSAGPCLRRVHQGDNVHASTFNLPIILPHTHQWSDQDLNLALQSPGLS